MTEEENIRREIFEHFEIDPIDIVVEKLNYKGCPCCGNNRKVYVLFWIDHGIKLAVRKIYIYYDELYDECRNFEMSEKKILPEKFEKWYRWEQNPDVMDAKNAMETKLWAKKEQTNEAWDKNREVY